jgi:hypothetical protein
MSIFGRFSNILVTVPFLIQILRQAQVRKPAFKFAARANLHLEWAVAAWPGKPAVRMSLL